MARNRFLAGLATALLLGACGVDPLASPDAPPDDAMAAASAVVLPLRRGFYVSSDTPCENASNATLLLLRRDALSGARDICHFDRFEQLGPTTFRVAERCEGSWQTEPATDSRAAVWEIQGPGSFRRVTDAGWVSEARFCEQSSLPEWWRDNDISDLID